MMKGLTQIVVNKLPKAIAQMLRRFLVYTKVKVEVAPAFSLFTLPRSVEFY